MAAPRAGPSKAVDSESDDDDFMPALPPSLRGRANGGPAPAPAPRPAGPIGPTLPPGFTRSDSPPPPPPPRAFEESDEEETGPMPMPAGFGAGRGVESDGENEGVRLMREREERERERERLEEESKAPKREAWMLLPPKESELMANFDPTKLQKSRGFRQTAKPHAGSSEKSAGPSELWTETPAERAKRMEDEVLGKRRRMENSGTRDEEEERRAEEDERKRRRRDEEMRSRVDQHNRSSKRSEALLDLHGQARDAVESAKSVAQREKEKKEETIWDRDSMMGSAGKLIGEKDRSKMVKDARGLGGRFGSGSFL